MIMNDLVPPAVPDPSRSRKARRQLAALPGSGTQKAQIFVALLGKQLGVRPDGWREAAGAFGGEGTRLSVADITDEVTLGEVRAYKQARKAAAKASAPASPAS